MKLPIGFRLAPLLFLGVLLSSCANFKLHYAKTDLNWQAAKPDSALKKTHTMYLVGDAGYLPESGRNPVLTYLDQQLPTEDKNSSVLFLGDNIYPKGMPPKSEGEKRLLAEQSLNAQLDVLDEFKGDARFIAGNHDWMYGLDGRRRQEKYVENILNGRRGIDDDDDDRWKNYYIPDDGCSGPEIIELNDQIVVVAIDSEWWLADWDREPAINDGCEIKSRAFFKVEMENALRKYRRKTVVVALHHPFYTNGPHGGKFSFKQHFFPLTQLKRNLYVPLPGLGSLLAFLRASVGSRQDRTNGLYKGLINAILPAAKKNGPIIFVSGHEHTLQYLENEGQRFVVSGSGSKTSPVKMGKGSRFAYGALGYSTIDFYENGEAWVHYWTPDSAGTAVTEIYRKQIREPGIAAADPASADFSEYEQHRDSVERPVIRDAVKPVSALRKFVLGRHYREVYMGTYTFPVLDLSTHLGGLKPLQQGGGFQTNSLRLADTSGRQYVLRDLTKDVSRLLPYPLSKMTAARTIAMDNFLSTHPFAALAIPRLAEAVSVYHANPVLCYVPKQPALGEFNETFGGSVYLFEERSAGDWSGTGVFGDSKKIVSTPKMLDKILSNNNHKIDQRWVLRSRLFDLVIGDWDRHDDQWRWARFEEGKRKIYRPVPRDRDQAFSKYDGLLTTIVRQTIPFLRQLRPYEPDIPNIKWASWNARYFDHSFMSEMSWLEWEYEAQQIRAYLTDEVIDEAFASWPERAMQLSGNKIKTILKKRRDNIVDFARRRYLWLAEDVDVHGTDEREQFDVYRESNGNVQVKIYEISKKGEKKDLVYERLFRYDETRFINLFGVGDDDVFLLKGQAEQSILVRLIGGQGRDVFRDSSVVAGPEKMTFIYDDLGENELVTGYEALDARTRQRIYNLYDHRAAHYEYDYMIPLPILGVNPDDGFTLGVNLMKTDFRFKKDPFHAQHNLVGSFAFATRAWYLQYNCDFLNVFGSWDFMLQTQYSGPTYAFNYFGYGNDSRADFENNDINYYRVRQSQIFVYPTIKKRFAGNSGRFFIGPVFDSREIQPTAGRFITSAEADIDPEALRRQNYLGARAGLEYNGLDNWLNPHSGILFNTYLGMLNNLDDEKRFRFGNLYTDFSVYRPLDRQESLILVTRLGISHNLGEGYTIYHSPRLGGRETLRGYRAERFYGKTAFWQNIDLRYRLGSSYNNVLPLSGGLFCGFDHGKVWSEEDAEGPWQFDYGGGLWLAPLDGLTLYFGVFQPRQSNEDGPRFFFRLGAGF